MIFPAMNFHLWGISRLAMFDDTRGYSPEIASLKRQVQGGLGSLRLGRCCSPDFYNPKIYIYAVYARCFFDFSMEGSILRGAEQ